MRGVVLVQLAALASLAPVGCSVGTVIAPSAASLAVDAQTSRVQVDRASATANGVDVVRITAVLVSPQGKAVGLRAVQVLVSGTGNTVAVPAQSDAGGIIVATLRSTVAEAKQVTVVVQATGGDVTLAATPSVVFVPGPIAQRLLQVEPTVFAAGSPVDVSVSLADAYGNAVSSAAVTFASSAPSGVFVDTVVSADAQGVARTVYTATRVGNANVTATFGTSALSALVGTVAADPNASVSSIDSNPSVLGADGNQATALTLWLTDAYGNPIAGALPTWVAEGAANTLDVSGVATDANGMTVATLMSMHAEPKRVSAQVGNVVVTGTVTFVPAAVGANTEFVVSATMGVADGNTVVLCTVTVCDGDDHPLANQNVTVTCRGMACALAVGANGNAAGAAASGVSDANGQVTVRLTSTAAGVKNVTARVAGFAVTQAVTFAVPECAGTLWFPGAPLSVTGNAPQGVAAADFNGDGNTDVAVANNQNDSITVFLGTASGLGARSTIALPTGSAPGFLLQADINGDRVPDLLAACVTSVALLLGQGDGTFAAPTFISTGSGTRPVGLVTQDINGDTLADLAVAYAGTSQVALFLNIVGATAAVPLLHSTGAAAPSAIAAADLNGDTWVDLAVTLPNSDAVGVFYGAAGGVFASAAVTFSAGLHSGPTHLVAADLSGDGNADLALTSPTLSNVVVLLATGGGAFAAPVAYAVGSVPVGIVAQDINSDSVLDLLSVNSGTGSVSVLTGTGLGGFRTMPAVAVGPTPSALAVATIGRDGYRDLVTVNQSADVVTWLPGNNDGTFTSMLSFATGQQPQDIAVGDINGDGLLDAVVANEFDSTVSVLLGLGGGKLSVQTPYAVGALPTGVALVDVNEDGRLDVLTANSGAGTVSVLVGQGNGTFAMRSPPLSAAAGTSELEVDDVNGDGKPDCVAFNASANTVSVFINQGGGVWAPGTSYAVGRHPGNGTLADLNRDGALDVVVANQADNTVGVLLNSGNGNFLAQVTYSTGLASSPTGVAALLRSHDSPVVAVTNAGVGTVMFFAANASGVLGAPTSVVVPGANYVDTGDLNTDGVTDLVVGGGAVNVLLATEPGKFGGYTPYLGGGRAAALADFDGDGRVDIATIDAGNNALDVLLSVGCH